MSLPKKKSRKVTVNEICFRWILGRYPESISGWREDTGMLSEEERKSLNRYRTLHSGNLLGNVTDLTRKILVELLEGPQSRLIINYSYLVFEGFSGVEPFEPVTNKTVAKFIEESIEAGWDPFGKESFETNKFQDHEELKEKLNKKKT